MESLKYFHLHESFQNPKHRARVKLFTGNRVSLDKMRGRRDKRPAKKKELVLPAIALKEKPSGEPVDIFDEPPISPNIPWFLRVNNCQKNDVNAVWTNSLTGKTEPIKLQHGYGTYQDAEKGLYNNRIKEWYKMFTRENSIILPPLVVSRKANQNSALNPDKLKEKKYVMDDYFKEGRISKFARDEIYLPNVYSSYFGCADCKRKYISDQYTDVFRHRNAKKPYCDCMQATRQHFCDVLGKKYCSQCGEIENRKFSRSMEDSLAKNIILEHTFKGEMRKKKKKKVSMAIDYY